MKSPNPVSASLKLLGLIKNGSKRLYPDLILPASGTPATATEEPHPGGDAPLTWTHFPLLASMRASLNAIWSSLVLKDASANADIAFYGCTAAVGTTFLSFHLALYLALSHGLRTIYVDTDGDKPNDAAHPIGPTSFPGLAAYYFRDAPLDACIHPTRVPQFFVLPIGEKAAGPQEPHPFPVQKIRQLTTELRGRFEAIVYDCQPVLGDPLGISFAQNVRHILLVSRYAVSRREVCLQTVETFRANNLDITGVVLNQREYPIPMKFYDLLK